MKSARAYFFHVSALLVLSCCCVVFDLTAARAETVTIEGIPFRVDSIRVADDASVELSLDGEHRIVSKDGVEKAVVEMYFRPNGKGHSLDPDLLERFIRASLKNNNSTFAGAALPFYMASPRLDTLSARDSLEEFSSFEHAGDAFKAALLTIRTNGEAFSEFRRRPDLVAVVLFTIGMTDGAWLRSNGVRWVFAFSDSFKSYAIDRLARGVSRTDRSLVKRLPEVLRHALGDEDGFYRSIRLLCERILQALEFSAEQSIDQLYPLVEAARRDPDSSRILYPLVAARLHEAAERLLDDGDPARALMVISRSDPDRRNPRTHEIIRRALEAVPGTDRDLVRDPDVETMVTAIALRDVEMRLKYEALLDRQLQHALSLNDVPRGATLLSKMVKVRADPDPKNDDIRVNLALAELRIGSREGALAQLAGVRTGIPLYDRMRLGLAGLYVNRLIAFVCVVVPLVYVIWFLIVELKRLRTYRLERTDRTRSNEQFTSASQESRNGSGAHRYENGHAEVSSDNGQALRNEARLFTQGALRKPSDPRVLEYQQCLIVLGLRPEASLKDIKTAYRSLVKYIHPDRLKENQGRASDRFIELTQAYDRAIELRRITGLEES